MIRNSRGYATIVTFLLLPLVFLCLGFLTFNVLKTRHQNSVKTACRDQYQQYFSQVKSNIQFIESFNPLALALYEAQIAMLPMIWLPPVAKAYQKLMHVRQKLEKMQLAVIKSFNSLTQVRGYAAAARIQRTLQQANSKVKATLKHGSTRHRNETKILVLH